MRDFSSRFHKPERVEVYFCGNSLGLQPAGVREAVLEELDDWDRWGVEGHFKARRPWYDYHEFLQEDMAAVVGATPSETVLMNALTVNLHLMLTSFYRPQGERRLILMESGAFPSDRYAVQSHLQARGLADAVVELAPRPGETCLRETDIRGEILRLGDRLALVLFAGVHYYTGQAFPIQAMTGWAHQVGALAGFDLAHAAGNLELKLHDWGVDFAVWCSYKYLNGGPGGVGGCFVHERHSQDARPRFAGWWGNDPRTRFTMPDTFVPQAGAAGWQLSNAPVLAMAALAPSLRMFREAGMAALRDKSVQLTGQLDRALRRAGVDVITPPERGCQLSLRLGEQARRVCDELMHQGIVTDYRSPDVVRVAPVPLYNSLVDNEFFMARLQETLARV
ncbi:MAG TPA: kynureninase [Candidatus Xenobia bacterium]|jgi:kynureninase